MEPSDCLLSSLVPLILFIKSLLKKKSFPCSDCFFEETLNRERELSPHASDQFSFFVSVPNGSCSRSVTLCPEPPPLTQSLGSSAAAAAKSLQSCPSFCNPTDCSLPGSSAHGIFQARVLEWGAFPSSGAVLIARKFYHCAYFFTASAFLEQHRRYLLPQSSFSVIQRQFF